MEYPTELKLEAFSPPYLAPSHDLQRPTVTVSPLQITYNTLFTITVAFPVPLTSELEINLVNAPYSTHSYQQGQRLVGLAVSALVQVAQASVYQVTLTAPSTPTVAPPGYYMLFAVNQAIPSKGVWVLLSTWWIIPNPSTSEAISQDVFPSTLRPSSDCGDNLTHSRSKSDDCRELLQPRSPKQTKDKCICNLSVTDRQEHLAAHIKDKPAILRSSRSKADGWTCTLGQGRSRSCAAGFC